MCQKTHNTTRLKCCACREKGKMHTSKVLRLPRNMQVIIWNLARVLPGARWNKTTLGTFSDTWERHEMPGLPRKTILERVSKPSTMRGFAASPIGTATPQENQRIEMRHAGASKWNEHFMRNFFKLSKTTFSHEFAHEHQNPQPQNQCFVGGFRQFSSHVEKMPRLPRNLHVVTTWRSPDNAIQKNT